MDDRPKVIVISGPNGSGKSTTAPRLLRQFWGVTEFVNADAIALGLSGLAPDRVAMLAGRVMLSRLRELAAERADFAFETTLASRTFHPWLKLLVAQGYEFHLIYLWLPSPDAAVARVAERVRMGGHDVPEATIRRRYQAGAYNFFELYAPLAMTWKVMDNVRRQPRVIARGGAGLMESIRDHLAWREFLQIGLGDCDD